MRKLGGGKIEIAMKAVAYFIHNSKYNDSAYP